MSITLKDLLVGYKIFEARKVNGVIIVRRSKRGLYRARNAEDVKNVLTNGKSLLPVYVRHNREKENWKELEIELRQSQNEKITEIVNLWVEWNAREKSPSEVMYQIEKVLKDETARAWKEFNNPHP